MKCALVLVLTLAVLLWTVSSEDLTDEEIEVEVTPAPKEGGEATLEGGESTPAPFRPPEKPSGDVYFAEPFTDADTVWKTWVPSQATKEGGEVKYDGEVIIVTWWGWIWKNGTLNMDSLL